MLPAAPLWAYAASAIAKNPNHEEIASMKRFSGLISAATCLIALSWSQVGLAQGNCGNIRFTGDITSRLPNARDACLGIVERDGRSYAHFEGRIVRVSGSEVVAEFRRPDGTYGNPVSFTPAADARVRIEGRSYRYRDLSRGQELDVYLPPDRWEIAVYTADNVDFETAPTVTAVPLREPSPEVAALPRTATPLPLLALAGVLLMGLGAVVAGVRYRLRRRV
jgi:hypothetical protein